jgi:KinB signaling pathway activation protein
MTLKKLFFWIGTTLLLGAVLAVLVSYVIGWITGVSLGSLPEVLLTGLTFAAVAELGFFSYLVFNWLARGLFRNQQLFVVVQILLIVILLGNLIYLNVNKFTGTQLWKHLVIPVVIMLISILVASWKAKQSTSQAFIPTFFFLTVATTLESIPSLNSKAGELPFPFVLFTVLILLICNVYQILQLSWLVTRSPKNK